MKNKRFTYVLLVVVGFIYFKLFVRISSNISEDTGIPAGNSDQLQIASIKPKQSFKLKANYADPFLKKSGLTTTPKTPDGSINNPASALPPPLPKKEKPVVYWPAIKYFGIVQRSSSKKPRALISVDGVMYKIYPNEELFDGLIVKQINREHIQVVYKKETQVFNLN